MVGCLLLIAPVFVLVMVSVCVSVGVAGVLLVVDRWGSVVVGISCRNRLSESGLVGIACYNCFLHFFRNCLSESVVGVNDLKSTL